MSAGGIFSRFSSGKEGKNMEVLANMDSARVKYLDHSAFAASPDARAQRSID